MGLQQLEPARVLSRLMEREQGVLEDFRTGGLELEGALEPGGGGRVLTLRVGVLAQGVEYQAVA